MCGVLHSGCAQRCSVPSVDKGVTAPGRATLTQHLCPGDVCGAQCLRKNTKLILGLQGAKDSSLVLFLLLLAHS